MSEGDHHPADAPVANDEIGAAPEDEPRQGLGAGILEDQGQVALGLGFDEKIGRPADAQRGAAGERFVAADHRAGQQCLLQVQEEVRDPHGMLGGPGLNRIERHRAQREGSHGWEGFRGRTPRAGPPLPVRMTGVRG